MAGSKGRSGRKPKPTALKAFSGAFEKNPQRRNHREPKAPSNRPKKPRHVQGTAATQWYALVKRLEKLKILSSIDEVAIEQYALTYAAFREAEKNVRKRGSCIDYIDANGNELSKRNPADTAMIEHGRRLTQIESEFGLTPSSRTRVQVPDDGTARGNKEKAARFLS